MTATTQKRLFLRGVMEATPFLLILIPFAMLFGVVATEAGLNLAEVMGFAVVIIAGAAQFTALQLMQDNAPTLVVIITALAVNLRMAMYSAAMTPHFGEAPMWQRAILAYTIVDQNFAQSATVYEREPDWDLGQKLAYFVGVSMPIIPMWYVCTYLGVAVGSALPDWLTLDIALPICFLALVAPALRTMAHVAAALTSGVLAVALAFLPFSLGLLVAGIFAMIVGARVEKAVEQING